MAEHLMHLFKRVRSEEPLLGFGLGWTSSRRPKLTSLIPRMKTLLREVRKSLTLAK